MVDDERWLVEEGIEAALIETHHLANISGVEEADQARERLVEAQSASSERVTRDHLADAREYLELARLLRRDCADGFQNARDRVARAEAALRFERPLPEDAPVEALLERGPRYGRSLAEIREQAGAGSFEQVRRDVALEEAFADVRRWTRTDDGEDAPSLGGSGGHGARPPDGANARDAPSPDGVEPGQEPSTDAEGNRDARGDRASEGDADWKPGAAGGGESRTDGDRSVGGGAETAEGGVADVEEALRAASLEVDIERALLRAADSTADSKFEFLTSDQLAPSDGVTAEEP